MNSRERFLLIILSAVIILFGGFKVLIEPQLTDIGKVGKELTALKEEQLKSQTNTIKASDMKENNKLLETKIKENSMAFFPELTTDKIHIWINGILGNLSINPTSVKISNAETAQISNPLANETDLEYPAKDAANGIIAINDGKPIPTPKSATTAKTTADTKQKAPDLIETMPVVVQYIGSFDQTLALIDAIKNSGRIARVTVMNASTEKNNNLTYSITIECYGIKKFTSGDVLSSDTLAQVAGKANPFS